MPITLTPPLSAPPLPPSLHRSHTLTYLRAVRVETVGGALADEAQALPLHAVRTASFPSSLHQGKNCRRCLCQSPSPPPPPPPLLPGFRSVTLTHLGAGRVELVGGAFTDEVDALPVGPPSGGRAQHHAGVDYYQLPPEQGEQGLQLLRSRVWAM